MAMPAGKSMWQQLGLTPHNALRYYLPAAAVGAFRPRAAHTPATLRHAWRWPHGANADGRTRAAYAGYALPSRVMHGEKPHTLSEGARRNATQRIALRLRALAARGSDARARGIARAPKNGRTRR